MASPRRRRSLLATLTATLLALVLLAGVGVIAAWAVSRGGAALDRLDAAVDLDFDLLGQRIPRVAYDAYRGAAARAGEVAPGCSVDWAVLAALARIESRHGQIGGSAVRADGTVTPPIYGPPLDGRRGVQAIGDTDGGVLDGDAAWDRAVGPFQFIPTSWRELGRDGNGDGISDPHNIHDAALAAVAHLCLRDPGDYRDRAQLRRALIGYNASGRYADDVLRWVDRYQAADPEEIVSG